MPVVMAFIVTCSLMKSVLNRPWLSGQHSTVKPLPTIKTDFLFENSQDFNQTTHARPQRPIMFIDNISLYFNCISCVKYVFKRSHYSHTMPFSAVWPKQFNVPAQKNRLHWVWKVGKLLACSSECQFFYSFYILKWRHTKRATRVALKSHIHKYFACYIILQLF